MTMSSELVLPIEELHQSLRSPAISSMSFLNEVMSRFPRAISFAPGAPNLALLADFDIERYLNRYIDELSRERGVPTQRGRTMLLEYGPSAGLINALIADAVAKDYKILAQRADLVVTVGAQEAMLLSLRVLCRPGRDLLAVVSPSYVGVIGAAQVLGLDIVGVAERNGELDLDALVAACREAHGNGQRIRALYVAPDFANPSGAVLSRQTRIRLLELAEKHDFFVLEDSAYGFTADRRYQLPALKALDNSRRVIYIATFAKIGAPGARVGFLIADQAVAGADGATSTLAKEIALVKSMVTVNTSPICQAIIGGLLLEHGGSLLSLAAAKTSFYRRNLGRLLDQLSAQLGTGTNLNWTRPHGGFFVRMGLPVAADVALLERSAAEFGVLWTPMSPFYLDSSGDREIRLSCSYLSAAEIEVGVGRLVSFLRSLPGIGSIEGNTAHD